jgi:predicted permease
MDNLVRDVRYALRLLAKAPGFAVAAVLILALGIGANIAMFSVVYGVLLRPLPYREADRLLLVRAEVDYAGAHRPVPVFVQSNALAGWQRPFDAIASTGLYATDVVALSGKGGSELLDSAVVSSTFFSTIAGPFAAGRPLDLADDASPSVVISERLARRIFQDPNSAIGRELTLTSRAYTVVGVAASAFQFPTPQTDAWLPAAFAHSVSPQCCGFRVIARLNAGGTVERARAAVTPAFRTSAGGTQAEGNSLRTGVIRLSDDIVAAVRPALLVLFAAVLMVLIIACSNLANLLLARNAARRREFELRRALGASSTTLIRQILVESAVLATGGALVGAALARLSLIALSRLATDTLPRINSIHIDWPVLLFAIFVAALTALGAGLVPALRIVNDQRIQSQGVGGTAAPHVAHIQRTMCIVQVALAVTLVVGATLLGRSLVRLLNVDLGVSTDHVLTASMGLAFGERPTDVQTVARVNRVIEAAQGLPGVRAVGVGTSLPPTQSRIRITLKRQGDVVDYQATAIPATPGYFSALQMRLIKGRFFTDADDDRHPAVMIMTDDTAKRCFGNDDPIGRTMSLPLLRDGRTTSIEMTLVGVIANVKYAGLGAPPDDAVFRPFAQQPWVAPFLVMRTAGDPAVLSVPLRRAIAQVDPRIVTSSVASLDELVTNAAAQPRLRTVLLASLGGLALGIAAVGLYGMVAYAVSRRTKEIGIRIALGATSHDVLGLMLGGGMIVGITGVGIGVAGALILARLLAGLLYGIAPTDPVSFGAASVGLLMVTLIASYIPARRAAHVNPIRALREE